MAEIKLHIMNKLTKREEEIMNQYWENGPMFVRELLEKYEEPRPHFNTLSTMVRILEANGFLSHEDLGKSYRYFPTVSREQYKRGTLEGVIDKYFGNSYLNAVSALVKEEKISLQDLKDLVSKIEKGKE